MGANQSGAAIGVAVIGTGNIAQSHLTAWKRLVDSGQARLEVACDNDLERARVAAERYGAAAWATVTPGKQTAGQIMTKALGRSAGAGGRGSG